MWGGQHRVLCPPEGRWPLGGVWRAIAFFPGAVPIFLPLGVGWGTHTHSPVSPERGELLSHPGGCDRAGGTCCSPPGLPIFAPLPPHIPVIVTVLSPGGGGGF